MPKSERLVAALAARREQASTRHWIERYQAGDPNAGDILLRAHAPMIWKIARRYSRPDSRDWSDCLQEGRLGLLRGVARHALGDSPTLPYLWVWVRHYVSRWLIDKGQAVRVPVQNYSRRKGETRARASVWTPHTKLFSEIHETYYDDVNYTFEDTLVDEDPIAEDTVADVDRQHACRVVATWCMRQLPTAIRVSTIYARFKSKPATLQEVADEYGVSRERIRQIEVESLALLRRRLPPVETDVFDVWLETAVRFVIARNAAEAGRAAA